MIVDKRLKKSFKILPLKYPGENNV